MQADKDAVMAPLFRVLVSVLTCLVQADKDALMAPLFASHLDGRTTAALRCS